MIVNAQTCCLSYPVLNRNLWNCHQLTQSALHWRTQLQKHLASLKTRMRKLRQGFHFLGVSFEVSRNPQGKIQETKVDIHRRTTRRALDKVMALRNNAEQ